MVGFLLLQTKPSTLIPRDFVDGCSGSACIFDHRFQNPNVDRSRFLSKGYYDVVHGRPSVGAYHRCNGAERILPFNSAGMGQGSGLQKAKKHGRLR